MLNGYLWGNKISNLWVFYNSLEIECSKSAFSSKILYKSAAEHSKSFKPVGSISFFYSTSIQLNYLTMKLFKTIIAACTRTLTNGISIFKDNMISSDPLHQYTRSELLNKVLAKRVPMSFQHIVVQQRIRNDKARELRLAMTELLNQQPSQKDFTPKKNSPNNKRKYRFNRFKKFHQ